MDRGVIVKGRQLRVRRSGVGLACDYDQGAILLGHFKDIGFPSFTFLLCIKGFCVNLVVVPHDEHRCNKDPHKNLWLKGVPEGPAQERAITSHTHAVCAR